jgi:hypothetical protein
MSSNMTTLVPDQAIGRSAFTDQTPQLKPDCMHWVLLIGFTLPSIFNLQISDARLGDDVLDTH